MDEKKFSWGQFLDKLKKIYIAEDGDDSNFIQEQPVIEETLRAIEKELNDVYKIEEPIGRGGAGVVVKLRDTRLGLDRALKIPRPKEKELIESVRAESDYLKKVRHKNIISVYYLGNVSIKKYPHGVPYFVMDYIEDAKDLRKALESKLSKATKVKELSTITRWIAKSFFGIAKAVDFLHQNDLIHFDIKPGNILIDSNEKPVLSDLGFVKRKNDSDIKEVVGFTLFYAHRRLRDEYGHMSSKNRVKKEMAPKDFQEVFDLYAFGKTLLEILSLVDLHFPDSVLYDYNFVYLHLAACRMLDGYNLTNSEIENIRNKHLQNGEKLSVYRETWVEIDENTFKEIKYKNFKAIIKDLDKLLVGRHFLETVSELNAFYTERIQCSEGIPAPFSERVKLIIEHPSFSRLSSVPQLGLLYSTYPTATHSRLEHSLGVFRNCCLFVQTLFNDQYNPLFRQLVDEDDIKCVLVASLIHDIGYYPLAHELEEIDKKFHHEKYTLKFLDSPVKDMNGYTLTEIIENKEWGWGIPIKCVKNLFNNPDDQGGLFQKKKIKEMMLSSIINGPIDVDKLDYILRDS